MSVTGRLATVLADRYRIEGELGAGGMATVYLAADLKHDRRVAIKVLKPELAAVLGAERFVQEIKTTAALSHPHILPLFDSGEADGFLYYVMPYLQGETIREKLNRETQFGIDEALKITTEVADALDYAHQNGVIHRDIKPENILLHNGRPMVMDFGIALAVSAAAGGRMTETGLSLGTPHYMSPEQATADRTISARSDIYSLASVLYEMLTGEPPHMGTSAQQIIMKIIAEPAKPATELRKSVPPNVSAALAKALEKLPADRFDNAKEFATALADRGFVGSTGFVTARGPGARAGVSRGVMIAAAVAVLAVGAALGYAAKPASPVTAQVVRLRVDLPSGTELALEGPLGSAIALSPDGTWIAVVIRETNRSGRKLYVRRTDRLELMPVAGTDGGAAPFFSPDSRTLGFVAADGRLRRVDIAGGPITAITDRPANPGSEPAWADDGEVYFRGTDFRIYRVHATGGASRLLGDSILTVRTQIGTLPAVRSFPAQLPGGRRILISECVEGIIRGNGNCNGRLVLMDVASGTVTPLDVPASRGWYTQGHLVLLSSEGALSAVEFDAASGKVRGEPVALLDGLGSAILVRPQVSVSATGSLIYVQGGDVVDRVIAEVDRRGNERVIVTRPGPYVWIRSSPDGTRISMIEQDARTGSQLFGFDKRTGTSSALTFAGSNQRPSWSPDSRRIAFSSSRDSVTDVWVVASDGSTPAQPVAKGRDVQQHTA
ncbi:MAG TPA: protein kinase, partial [Gemmatimonadaceae bacterium]